jgi:hypothetical protein
MQEVVSFEFLDVDEYSILVGWYCYVINSQHIKDHSAFNFSFN